MENFEIENFALENFVNRETEMQLIEERFHSLLKNSDLVRTQIIQFHGVGGIGKTTMLKKARQRCHDMHLPSIWADGGQKIPDFSHTIVHQVQQYSAQFTPGVGDPLDQSVNATRALLAQGPVVMLLDSLDAADEEQLAWIEAMLEHLITDNRLLAVVASKRIVPFGRTLSIARRLAPPFQLKSFDRQSFQSYINNLGQSMQLEIADTVFEWTHGYPLAVNAMVRAIREHQLDPRKEPDQKQLLLMLIEEVIHHGVLSNVSQLPADLAWYQTMLGLFSIPRRCNLSIMQRMIERFAPDYQLGSSLAYIGLQKRINQVTDVLHWNHAKAGFSVDAPIRQIFITKWRIEESERYMMIHNFLALRNRRLADEVSGTDRVHCLLECLYHSAHCEDVPTLQQTIERTVRQVVAEPPESFVQFHEEFESDEELKTALGVHSHMATSLVHKHLSDLDASS